MSTEMTQIPAAAAAQTPTNPPAGQPAGEQPKDTPANPAAVPAAPAPTAPAEPAPAAETPFLEEETLGLSNRTWLEILGITAAAAAGYFAGKYMASKSDDPAV